MLHAVGPIFYCDPDVYPVGFGTSEERTARGFAKVQQDPEALRVILADLHQPAGGYSEAVKARIWDVYKRMNALHLQPAHDDGYSFTIIPLPPGGGQPPEPRAKARDGYVSRTGAVYLGAPHTVAFVGCPICLILGTVIDTPTGPVRVEDMHVGDPIWTADARGHRVPGHVKEVGRIDVGTWHAVLNLRLADGRQLPASPGHPLDDGRHLADLQVGDVYDGSRVTARTITADTDGWTYDVLPSGPTGTYWADGVRVGSTLRR